MHERPRGLRSSSKRPLRFVVSGALLLGTPGCGGATPVAAEPEPACCVNPGPPVRRELDLHIAFDPGIATLGLGGERAARQLVEALQSRPGVVRVLIVTGPDELGRARGAAVSEAMTALGVPRELIAIEARDASLGDRVDVSVLEHDL
jgi:hypothetical protein